MSLSTKLRNASAKIRMGAHSRERQTLLANQIDAVSQSVDLWSAVLARRGAPPLQRLNYEEWNWPVEANVPASCDNALASDCKSVELRSFAGQ